MAKKKQLGYEDVTSEIGSDDHKGRRMKKFQLIN